MIIKKITALTLSIMFIFSSTAFGSDLYTVYDLSHKSQLSSGITYESTEKYTSKGWMNLNIVRANLTDEYTKIKPITSDKGVSNRATLSSMITSTGAVAGINGDFFLMGDPTYTYGALIDDGKMITSPLPYSYGYPTISRLLNGTVNVSLWNPKITLYGSNGNMFDIVVYNKTSSLDYGPTILTSDWNLMSIGYKNNKNIVEVVVSNNYVSEVRINQPSTIIPKDGYVIASTNAATRQKLLESFIQGSALELNIELDFGLDDLEWAVGGLNYLVKDGTVNDISSEVLGTHPRTAIGFNKDNTEMIFLTIDGRNKNYVGVKQSELAEIMIDLGAYNVINMDGGGSTTMGVDFLRNSNISIVNLPSDGRERKIASGVGVFNTAPNSDVVESIKIITNDDKVFNNTDIKLDLVGYNKYFAEVAVDKNNIIYEVSPNNAGTFKGDVFLPKSATKATITAYLGDVSGSIEIDVLDSPISLKFETDELSLDYGEKFQIQNIIGIDKNGHSAHIPSNYISYSYRNRIGNVENGVFTANDTSNTGAITATFGNAIKHIQVKIGYRMKTLNRFEDLDNIILSLYPKESDGNIEITKDFVKEGYNSLELNYDFTKMTDQSIAFIDFEKDNDGIKLEGKPKAIGMWVYGDGKSHWLRCRITDVYNTQTKLTFEDEVNWTGWKWVTAKIPDGISYPITLNNIYLAEINEMKKNAGTIYIDNLRLMYEQNDKDLGLKEETKFIDKMKKSKIDNFSEKLIISPGQSKLISHDGTNIKNGQIVNFDGIITNGTMSSDNKTMWNNIKSMINFKDKVLVLSLNGNLNEINDEREIKVLKDIFKKSSINNTVFVVYKGDKEETFIEDGIRYITYDDILEIGLYEKLINYKN